MVKINGTDTPCDGMSVAEWLASAGFERDRVAVELNGGIVPRAEYDATRLEDGDKLEVVRFVGGG